MAANLTKILFTLFSGMIAGADIKTGEVPRLAFIAAFPVFLLLKIMSNEDVNIDETIKGFAAGLFIFLFAYIMSGKKLGLADVWYSALAGMLLGPLNWYTAIAIACVGGIILAVLLKKPAIPFIPCMAAGSVFIFLTGGWQWAY